MRLQEEKAPLDYAADAAVLAKTPGCSLPALCQHPKVGALTARHHLIHHKKQPRIFVILLSKAASQENKVFVPPRPKSVPHLPTAPKYISIKHLHFPRKGAHRAFFFVLFKINPSSSERAATPPSYFSPFGGTFAFCCCLYRCIYTSG